jgi:hypothetical protein
MSIIDMLEKLAEMFPKQDYHTRLDRYITAKHPKSAADVEQLQRQFETHQARGLIL